MKSSLITVAVIIGGLALTHAALRPVAAPLWAEMRAAQPALRLATAGAVAGQGLTLGVLGGFTTFSSFGLQTFNLMAGGDWLRAGLNAVLSVVLCLLAVWTGHMAAAVVSQR